MPEEKTKKQRKKERREHRRAERSQMKRRMREFEKNNNRLARLAKKQAERLKQQGQRMDQYEVDLSQYGEDLKHSKEDLNRTKEDLNHTKEDLNRSILLLKTTVVSTVLPIIAAVVYKSIYQIGFGYENPDPGFGDNRADRLWLKENEFHRFGMKSIEEMHIFAATVSTEISCQYPILNADLPQWPTTINERNSAAHAYCIG